MGHVLGAACLSCGYERRLLEYEGALGIEMEPQICFDCSEIVSVPIGAAAGVPVPKDLNRCPICNGKNLKAFLNSDRDPDVCPRCGSQVRVWSIGIWD